MKRRCTLLVAGVLLAAAVADGQTREEKVLADREKVEAEGFWIYNDLDRGVAEAKRTGKPIVVVLRCIPCEECVKLDEELMEKDPLLKPMLDKFVRVRIVGTNGLDLSLFQCDYDQSFAVFLMNADKTIYGRFGTRSDRTLWADDVSIEGLAKAMEAALALHQNYPANKQLLAGKQGKPPLFPTPEKFPSLAEKYESTLNYEGNVVKSCIHCHQIGDAQRDYYRSRGQPIPRDVLFQYPHPKILGMIVDPTERATLKEVEPGSIAAAAGLKAGDEIWTMEGQPILSLADMQWVLHHLERGPLRAKVRRGDRTADLQIPLPDDWRTRDNLSWRVSSWPMRRMVLGGMVLTEALADDDPQLAGGDTMALKVKHVGQYGPHAAAKRAGFRVDDVIIEYDGRDDLLRETDLLAYAVNARRPGERVKVRVVRDGRELEMTLPIQE